MDLTQHGDNWGTYRFLTAEYEIEESGHEIDTPVFDVRARDADGNVRTITVEGFRPYFGIPLETFQEDPKSVLQDRRVLAVRCDCDPDRWRDVLDVEIPEDAVGEDVASFLTEQTSAVVEHDLLAPTTIRNESVAVVYVRTPGDVAGDNGMRDLFETTYEADIPFVRRFLISTQIYDGFSAPTDSDRIRYENCPATASDPPVRQLSACEPPETQARMCVFDIEVAVEGEGFPEPHKARHPITAVTAYDSYDDEYALFGLAHESWADEASEIRAETGLELVERDGFPDPYNDSDDPDLGQYHIYDDETTMLEALHDWILSRDPDFITGWNSEDFDVPYLIQRSYYKQAHQIRDYSRRSNPAVWTDTYNGELQTNFSLPDRVTVDLLEMYKKTQYHALDNNKLDTIANAELGYGKEDLAGDELDEAWKNDPVTFFVYNVRDTQATAEIEQEVGLLDLYDNLRSVTGATYEACNNNGPMLDTLFCRRAYEQGLILPTNTEPDESVYHGAKVFDTVPGVHSNAVYPDLSSLYPSLLAMMNLGSETIIGDEDDLAASEYSADDCFRFPVDDRPFAEVPKGESIDHVDRDEYKGVKTPDGDTREMFEPEFQDRYVLKPDVKESFITSTVDDLIDLKYQYSGNLYEAVKRVTNSCFTPDTQVLTPDGVTNIRELDVGDEVYSLDTESGEMQIKPVTETIEKPSYSGELVDIETVRSDFRVTPDHRMLLQERSDDSVSVLEAGEIEHDTRYLYPTEWQTDHGDGIDAIDVTRFLDGNDFDVMAEYEMHGHAYRSRLPDGCTKKRRNSHYGFVFSGETFLEYQDDIEALSSRVRLTHPDGTGSTLRPYQFDGDAFIEFLGWFIAEGSVYSPAGEQTKSITIAQENDETREQIADVFDRLQITPSVDEQGFTIGSAIYGSLLQDLCGDGSRSKQIPEFVFAEASKEQKQLLLDTLMDGDGHDGIYYTASDELKDDVARLCVHLGITPMISKRDGTWEITVKRVEDGFSTYGDTVTRSTAENGVYCVQVADNHTLLAGRNGKFQWVGNCYGVIGDSDSGGKGFRLYDRRVAEGITLAGRLTIQHTAETFTQYLRDEHDPDAQLLGGDTDSSVTTIPNAPDFQTARDWAEEAVEYVEASYDEFVQDEFGFDADDEHRLAVELENLSSKLLFIEDEEDETYRLRDDGYLEKETDVSGVKKRYAEIEVWNDSDGWIDTDYSDTDADPLTDELDRSELKHQSSLTYQDFESGPMAGAGDPSEYVSVSGFELVRSDSAQITRDAQLQVLTDVLLADDPLAEIAPYLRELTDQIESREIDLSKLGRPTKINQPLDDYGWTDLEELDDDEITPQVEANGGLYKITPSPGYRGAKYADDHFDWEELSVGSKPVRLYIDRVRSDEYPAAYQYDSYPQDDRPAPPEVGRPVDAVTLERANRLADGFVIDTEKTIDRALRGAIEPILETLGQDWDETLAESTQTGLGAFA